MDQSQRYLTRLRRALVCSKRDRERLLSDARDMLENFAQENPGAFYQDYVASFGQPEDFAAEMLSNLDPEDIADVQRRRRRVFLASAGAVAAMLALLAGFWFGRQSGQQPSAATPQPTAPAALQSTSEPTLEPSPAPEESPSPGKATAEAYVERTFTDSGEIQHKEAVAYLSRLEIMYGTDDGYFYPTACINRAQAARLVTLIMTGGSDRDPGVKSEASFSDIRGHWAEAYIEYCRDLGIVDGKEDGSFAPDEELSALELIQMVLRMLGYDANAYRLRGDDWAVRVDELARSMDPSLYEELTDVVISAPPVTRDTAAQILFNALRATPKCVVPSQNPTDGTVSWQYVDSPNILLQERFNLELEDISFD